MPQILDPAGLLQIEALLNRCFPVPSGSSFYDDFPVWDPRRRIPGVRHFGLKEGEQMVASATLREAPLQVGGKLLRAGLIGGVATDPGHRGHGHASRLVEEVVQEAKASGVQVLLLWGSEHALYERLGFALAGRQVRFRLSDLEPLGEELPQGRIRRGWEPAIFELMRQRADGLKLRTGDAAWLSGHRNTQWWSWERIAPNGLAGATVAYAAIDRGIDLGGFVHEWGGSPAELRALLHQIRHERPEAWLLGPSDTQARLGLRELPQSWVEESLALCQSLDPMVEPLLNSLWIWGLDAA